jgi:hypothetical protein
MLTKRDKAIIRDLNKFCVMDRDSIAELHFANVKNPISAANTVLLRLIRDGQIQRTTSTSPFCYFGQDVQMKQNSAKLGHFLAILNVYKEMRKLGAVESFIVEPKYGAKGTVEPDIFAVFRKTPFFIEVQKTVYSERQMNEKLARYIDLYESQPFRHILIITEQQYALSREYPFRIFQAPSVTEFMQSLQPKPKPNNIARPDGIKIVIG